jgi:Raf kinase inhibitor-like YbhB/YbcL family protein
MKAFCPALLSGKYIPTKHANTGVQGGHNVSLPVSWTEVPQGTRSFVLTFTEEVSRGKAEIHWCVCNLPASVRGLPEGVSLNRKHMPESSLEMRNRFGALGYGGPQVQRGAAPHTYRLTVYALKVDHVRIGPYASYGQLMDQLYERVLDQASIEAVFQPDS